MLIANVYGRLGADPVERQTRSGKSMTTASVAVDVAGKEAQRAYGIVGPRFRKDDTSEPEWSGTFRNLPEGCRKT